jgi:hypothetical protein
MIGGIIDIAGLNRRMDNWPNVTDIPSGGQWGPDMSGSTKDPKPFDHSPSTRIRPSENALLTSQIMGWLSRVGRRLMEPTARHQPG